jgi:ParB family chromosome partitioning protein
MEAVLEQPVQKDVPSIIPANMLRLGSYNPRRWLDPVKLQELAEAIKAQGILQPILVRPVEGGYEIIAGQRRWRAAQLISETFEVPVFIREMTDEEAIAASTNENVIREDMSPAEEAEAAAKVLGDCSGNKEEAAKRLGWTVTTLEKRLALMNCSENVRTALVERKIMLGHAELLATATKEKQDQVLSKIMTLPKLPTVQEFKAQLEQISKSLEAAIFDKADCAGCQYNSSNQGSLFGESIHSGHCTNGACYDDKTTQELDVRVAKLKEEYPVIKIVKPGENHTVIRIVAEGKNAVGEEQAKACRGCANFGAAISSIPGSVGNVYRDHCFDTACNTKKVAAYIKSQQAPVQEKAKPQANQSTEKPKAAEKPATEVQDSTRVKEYRIKTWRAVLKAELMAQKDKNQFVLIALGISGYGRWISGNKMSQAYKKLMGGEGLTTTNLFEVASKLESAPEDAVELLNTALAASIESDIEVRQMGEVLQFLGAKLEKHWRIDAEYLDLLTKSEIELVADEIGLKATIGDKFSSLMAGKKADLIKSLLSTEGFEFEGKVPKNMNLS